MKGFIMFLRAPYNYDVDAVSRETGLDVGEETTVQQSFKEECDINTIVRRFGLTGELPNGIAMPLTGDFTNVPDYQSALNLIRQADEEFMRLPGEVRRRFGDNPAALIAFVEDDKNREEAVKLGIVEKPAEVPRPEVP